MPSDLVYVNKYVLLVQMAESLHCEVHFSNQHIEMRAHMIKMVIQS